MVHKQRGFTILELMIAISVFGVAMLLFTMGALQVSRSYQQATVKTKLTSATRELHQEFTQGIEYNGADIPPSVVDGEIQRICFNGKRYLWNRTPTDAQGFTSFELREQLMTSANGITCGNIADYTTDAKNPLPKGGRASKFGFSASVNIYKLETRFIAGEDDMFNASDPNQECRSAVLGGEFCATVEQTSTVTRKVL